VHGDLAASSMLDADAAGCAPLRGPYAAGLRASEPEDRDAGHNTDLFTALVGAGDRLAE